jgi:hypothetical protein
VIAGLKRQAPETRAFTSELPYELDLLHLVAIVVLLFEAYLHQGAYCHNLTCLRPRISTQRDASALPDYKDDKDNNKNKPKEDKQAHSVFSVSRFRIIVHYAFH